MKNLENIPKNHPFKVPGGYFDELPMIIQSRVAAKAVPERSRYFRYALQYALPALVLIVVAFFVFRPAPTQNAEDILASVETADLVAYLANTDMTVDEIVDEAQFDVGSVEAIEDEAYFSFDESDLDDIYLEDLQLDSGNNL